MSGLKSQLRLRVLLPTAVVALAGVGMSAFAFGGSPPVEGADPLPPPPSQQAGGGTATTRKAAALSPTLASWAKRANALCRETLGKVDGLESAQTPEELQERLETTLELASDLATRLSALPRPAGEDGRQIERLLALAARSNEALSRAVAIGSSPATAADFADHMDESHRLGERFDALAVRVGAKECAVDSTKRLTPLERALLREKVVVVVLHAEDAPVDRLAIAEARAGAQRANVGFLAVDVGGARDLAALTTAYDVRKAPAVLVMRRWVGAVNSFGGWVDATTVAQAARNARA